MWNDVVASAVLVLMVGTNTDAVCAKRNKTEKAHRKSCDRYTDILSLCGTDGAPFPCWLFGNQFKAFSSDDVTTPFLSQLLTSEVAQQLTWSNWKAMLHITLERNQVKMNSMVKWRAASQKELKLIFLGYSKLMIPTRGCLFWSVTRARRHLQTCKSNLYLGFPSFQQICAAWSRCFFRLSDIFHRINRLQVQIISHGLSAASSGLVEVDVQLDVSSDGFGNVFACDSFALASF